MFYVVVVVTKIPIIKKSEHFFFFFSESKFLLNSEIVLRFEMGIEIEWFFLFFFLLKLQIKHLRWTGKSQ